MKKSAYLFLILITVISVISVISLGAFAREASWDGTASSGFESGSGTESDPFIVKTPSQLAYLSKTVAEGNDYLGSFIKLESDLILNTVNESTWPESPVEWLPIGNPNTHFQGSFDGNGHRISGMFIDSAGDCLGLFGVIGDKGTVSSVCIALSLTTGNAKVGSIAGENNGMIINCHNIDQSVRGNSEIGGITGKNNGTVANCSNRCWVGRNNNSGGIAGINCGTVENCYNTGTVDGGYLVAGGIAGENRGTLRNCYNVGYIVSEYGQSGSIAGTTAGGTAENCYFVDRGSSSDVVGTAVPEERFTNGDSFAGFDFEKIWTMDGEEDYLYPELRGSVSVTSAPQDIPSAPVDSSESTSDPLSESSDPEEDDNSGIKSAIVIAIVTIIAAFALVLFFKRKK